MGHLAAVLLGAAMIAATMLGCVNAIANVTTVVVYGATPGGVSNFAPHRGSRL